MSLLRRALALAAPFMLCVAVTVTWALATPMFGAPDEISHMVRGAGAARGDLDGHPDAEGNRSYPAPAVLVPGGATPSSPTPICYALLPSQSADCLVLVDGPTQPLFSSASSYPPLYYLAVGWPTRLVGGARSLYAMRVVSACAFAGMLALALATLRRWSPSGPAFFGWALATTPMVWFLGGAVNPSSIAIAAGGAAWCGGLLLGSWEEADVSRHAWRLGLPLCILLLVRRDSILWAGLIVAALACLVDRRRIGQLFASRAALAWGVVVVACAVVASRTGIDAGSDIISGTDERGSVSGTIGLLDDYVVQMIGLLGWLDTRLPAGVYTLWFLAAGALVGAALGRARPRMAWTIAAAVVVLMASIVVIGVRRPSYLQGRYAMPFAVGIPLLAGLALRRERAANARSRVLAGGVVIAIEALSYYQQFRRYAVSGETTWWVFGSSRWSPPVPFALLLLVNVAAIAGLCAWMAIAATNEDSIRSRRAAANESHVA